jgi:tRNA(Arg) A34 adenosine deaminase TadA
VIYAQVHLTLPAWVHEFDVSGDLSTDEAKVSLAIKLANRNVEENSGGPFGAAIFDQNHRLISIGVNRVVPHNASVAHAEMMAFMTAQQRLNRFRLNVEAGLEAGKFTLATSAQPCCMCYGATVWAGVDRVLIGARASDVEELSEFDEGPLPADWQGDWAKRGIASTLDVCREAAREVFISYRNRNGARY